MPVALLEPSLERIMKYLLFLLPALMWAQPTNVQVRGTTPTQAIVQYTAPDTAACTVLVSELPALTPVVNDTNTSLFAGITADTYQYDLSANGLANENRAVSGTGVAGVRVITIGQRVTKANGKFLYSLALRADADHYGSITCTGGAVSFSFRTKATTGITPKNIPYNSSGHGNFGVPDFDWTDKTKPVIDPQTGVAIYRVSDPQETGFINTVNFQEALTGTSWTGLADLNAAPGGSTATSATTNTAFLPLTSNSGSYQFSGGFSDQTWYALANIGITVYGSATNTTGTNADVAYCLSINSGQSCYSGTNTVTLTSSPTTLTTAPASFPASGFAGWDKILPREHLPKWGTASVSGTTMTMAGPAQSDNWSAGLAAPEWVSGTKIYIAGSSPTCTNNRCTVSAVTSSTTVTLVESLSLSGVAWSSENVGMMVWKVTATGSVSISAQYKVQGYIPLTQASENACSTYTVTANVDAAGNAISPGVEGYLCLIPKYAGNPPGGARYLYFIGKDVPDFRFLSPLRLPITGMGANDLPIDPTSGNSTGAYFGLTPNVFYVSWPTLNSSSGCSSPLSKCPTLFSLTYTGDYRAYGSNKFGALAYWDTGTSDPVTWVNLNTAVNALSGPAAASAGCPTSFWGVPPLTFYGINGTTALFTASNFAQEYGACVFEFDLVTGAINQAFNTFNSSILSGGGLHSQVSSFGVYGLYGVTRDVDASGVRTSGPYQATATHVFKSGVANTDTSLPWPPDSTYDNTCPSGLPAAAQAIGGTAGSTLCVKFRFSTAVFCDLTPQATEESVYPCPYNSSYSYITPTMQVGDYFYNPAHVDGERFMIAEITGNDVIAIRDTGNGYACQPNPSAFLYGRICAATPSQATHNDNWVQYRTPPGGLLWFQPGTGTFKPESAWLTRGHFDIDTQGSNFTYLGIEGNGGYVSRVGAFSAFGSTANLTYFSRLPLFNGVSFGLDQWTQSYIAAPGRNATGAVQMISADWRHLNSAFGDSGERATPTPQTIGSTISTFTLQGGTTGVYLVGPISGTWDRQRPMFIYVAQYVFTDKSSATQGTTLTDADTWRYCYVLIAGECRSGSTAGQLYIVAPLAQNPGQCWGSQISQRNVCIWAADAITSQIVQMDSGKPDPNGIWQRTLGFGLTRPGAQYVYSKAKMTNDGLKMFGSVHHMGGWFSGPIWINPGQLKPSTTNGTTYAPVYVKASGNVYVEFGDNSSFYCSSRSEVCRAFAETIAATPWCYPSEASCSTASSATVAIPAKPDRLVYFRVVSGGVPGVLQVAAP